MLRRRKPDRLLSPTGKAGARCEGPIDSSPPPPRSFLFPFPSHALAFIPSRQILAVKSSTYYLGEVPELHSLVENMTSQQLAHFSRVLALLVFEPEYRQLMENAHVLRYGIPGAGGGGGRGAGLRKRGDGGVGVFMDWPSRPFGLGWGGWEMGTGADGLGWCLDLLRLCVGFA